VRASCGCTTAQVVQTTLAPGQDTAIVTQMDTRRFFGHKSVTIYVQFDQPAFAEVPLWVQANSRDDLTVLPEGLAFGRVKHGGAPSASVAVSFLGNSGAQIINARCDSNYVKLEVQEVRREASEVDYQVSARIRPDTPAGKWYTDVWLGTNDPSMPRVRIPLTVQIDPAPPLPTLALGLVKAGTQAERKIIIRAPKPFRVTSITGVDGQLRLRDASSESRNVHVLTVTLQPREPGMLNRAIRVKTDMGAGKDMEFNARAQVIP
jgi:hypothetical protein